MQLLQHACGVRGIDDLMTSAERGPIETNAKQ
jgi:hypothetical protein